MRLSAIEIQERGLDIKGWCGAMQRASRSADGPTFALKGPCSLPVRSRRSSFGAKAGATQTVNYPFMGGEKFRVSSVICTQDSVNDSWNISLSMLPATMDLAAKMTGMTVDLDQAMALFDTLEDFALSFETATTPVSKREAARAEKQQREAALEANDQWGCW